MQNQSNVFDHRRKTSLERDKGLQTLQNSHSKANIASGGAPLRTSFQEIAKRDPKRLSV